jgi:aryl-alcohol dehydrogenase-like predicted oxidoreductase
MSDVKRLVLGTAQLGMDYGVANHIGQPDQKTATAIVKAAWEGGVRTFDTAQAYGTSESVLGKALFSLGVAKESRIITKVDPSLGPQQDQDFMAVIEKSLRAFKVDRLHGLLLHREEQLDRWNDALGAALRSCLRAGMTEQVGVSVYSPRRALEALEMDGITMVQIPSNILDDRFERTNVFYLARNQRKQIYVRSVFLQGLLLIPTQKVPSSLKFALPVLQKFHGLVRKWDLTLEDAAIGYVREAYPDSMILFGAESPDQVVRNLDSWSRMLPAGFCAAARLAFPQVEERVINPTSWAS